MIITQTTNFNSIKVRLELTFIPDADTLKQFQFHKGTIRTDQETDAARQQHQFQFHKGTIRTLQTRQEIPSAEEFQFHKGTIRT